MIYGAQIRMARGYLKWSVNDLATHSGVAASTIKRMEAADGIPEARTSTITSIRDAIELAGVELLLPPMDGIGIRLKDTTKTDNLYANSLGQAVKAWREHRQLSISHLSALSGTSPAFIQSFEVGGKIPNVEIFQRISQALDVPMTVLLSKIKPNPTTIAGVTSSGEANNAEAEMGPTTPELEELISMIRRKRRQDPDD